MRTGHDYRKECLKLIQGYEVAEGVNALWRRAADELGIYTERQINLPLSITGCAQPHKEICRFAAAAGTIPTADYIGRGYNIE